MTISLSKATTPIIKGPPNNAITIAKTTIVLVYDTAGSSVPGAPTHRQAEAVGRLIYIPV